MSTTQQLAGKQGLKDLDSLIEKAIKKINGSQENDICKFLPVETGGYMHHFTLRKMKSESPAELKKMIGQYILDTDRPRRVPHKPRRPRGSRKKHDVIALSRTELDRVLTHLRTAGDPELAARLSPRRSLPQLKRALIASIRKNDVDLELWNMYVDAVTPTSDDPAKTNSRQYLIAASTQS